jgi:beta-galactosidase
LDLNEETIRFPRKEMLLKGETTAILPFNMEVNSVLMKYVTAQPIGRITKGSEQYLFLMQIPGMETELDFDAATVRELTAEGFKKETVENVIYLSPETGTQIKITAANGHQSTLVLLSGQEAENCWRINIKGQESMIITKADLMVSADQMEFIQLDNPSFEFKVFPDLVGPSSVEEKLIKPEKTVLFNSYSVHVSAVVP